MEHDFNILDKVGYIQHRFNRETGRTTRERIYLGVIEDFDEEYEQEWEGEDEYGNAEYSEWTRITACIRMEDDDLGWWDVEDIILWEESAIGKTKLSDEAKL